MFVGWHKRVDPVDDEGARGWIGWRGWLIISRRKRSRGETGSLNLGTGKTSGKQRARKRISFLSEPQVQYHRR